MKKVQEELLSLMARFRKLDFQTMITGLTKGEFGILAAITKLTKCCKTGEEISSKVKVTDISKVLNVSKPQVSKLLTCIENKGYAKRIESPDDKRVTFIELTEEGDAVVNKAFREMEKFSDKVFDELGEEDANELLELISKMYSIMERNIEDYKEKRKKENA